MDAYKKKLIRRLKAKCSEVNDEFIYVNSIYEKALPLFCDAVRSYCESNSLKNPLESLKKEPSDDKKDDLTDNIKSVYREIAKQTHPDLSGGKDDKIETYRDAANAKKESDINKLMAIAKELKIDITNLEYNEIDKIESSIKIKEDKIVEITNSYPYLWFFSEGKKRAEIISGFTFKMCNT